MEQLRPRPALDRHGQVKPAVWVLLGWLLAAGPAWGHAGTFILAKGIPDDSGTFTLELTVDYGQHPLLTDRQAAVGALQEILRVETAAGPVPLPALANGVLTDSATPDPELPLPKEPEDAERPHRLVVMRYVWQPDTPEVRFSVPRGNPYDVLFWLSGPGQTSGKAPTWRILIAGDQTPPIPVPRPAPAAAGRFALAGLLLSGVVAGLWWRRKRLGLRADTGG